MCLFLLIPQDDMTFRDVIHDWHHDTLTFVQNGLPRLVAVLILAFVLLRIVLFFVNRIRRLADRHMSTSPQRANELRTVASILRATAYGIIGFIVLLHVLSVLGINLAPLLASAGVVGVGIGLGAQSLFKDMLNGLFILLEGQYNIGDTVTIASLSGTVEDISLRITKLRDGNGTLYFIPNSQVATVSNLSRDFTIAVLSIAVDATADPDKVLRILHTTAQSLRDDPAFQSMILADPDIPGIDAITGRVVTYPVNIRVRISRKDKVLRELRRRVIHAFEQNGIPLGTDPTNMLLMRHVDPTAPPAQQPLIGS